MNVCAGVGQHGKKWVWTVGLPPSSDQEGSLFFSEESGVWVLGIRSLLTLSKMDNFLFFFKFSFLFLFLDDLQEEKEVGGGNIF